MAEKVKTILITQQDPGAEKNPYVELAKKHKLRISGSNAWMFWNIPQ
jgi:hypothetical protein